MTTEQKCRHIWTCICEDRQCDFSWEELEALQEAGLISELRCQSKDGWTFTWEDKLRDLALSAGAKLPDSRTIAVRPTKDTP